MTALSLLWLELGAVFSWGMGGKLRRFACRIADYGPVSILLMSAIFLLSFRPFAAALQRYRDTSSLDAIELFNSQLWALADRNPLLLFDPASQWTLWLFFIVALVVSAVTVILRSLLRARAAHTPAP